MLVKTRFFGEVDLPEEKILTFEHGLIGLGEYKKFTILYDCDKEEQQYFLAPERRGTVFCTACYQAMAGKRRLQPGCRR